MDGFPSDGFDNDHLGTFDAVRGAVHPITVKSLTGGPVDEVADEVRSPLYDLPLDSAGIRRSLCVERKALVPGGAQAVEGLVLHPAPE